MRAVVIGGTGNFGARICRALAGDRGIEVVATGRNPSRSGARLELYAADFSSALAKLAPDVVVHCAGPFQGQDYRAATAALAAGAHYLDLADGRDFVARFAEANDAAARRADRIALSGASTLPALSSAVVDQLAKRLKSIEEIRIAIAPGQKAPRGEATIAAVFSYAGKPFRWWRGGEWREVHGWQAMRHERFDFGARWAAACDVPDLELFPRRYPGVRTVEFRAALELGLQQWALWLAAAARRAGMELPIELRAAFMNRVAGWMDGLGGEFGGMKVVLAGTRADGSKAEIEWQVTTAAENGPEIPCMAAILLVRKLARGEVRERGAFPCVGFLTLEEFEGEFVRWKMAVRMRERNA